MKARNLWEHIAIRKLTTPAAVDEEIQRCNIGRLRAPTAAHQLEWARKLTFLDRLRQEVTVL